MLEVLRDAAWQFLGVLFGLLAIGVAVAIYYLQKQRKELAFGVLSARSLVTVSERVASRVLVSFDGVPVTNIRLVVIGLKNSGDKPLLATDFERPLTVSFGSTAKVLSADITRQSPSNLGAIVLPSENGIQVLPLLLNSGDHLIIQVLLAAPSLDVKTNARIVGISALAPLNSGLRLKPGALRNLAQNVLIVAVLGGLVFALNHFGDPKPIAPPPPQPPTSPWSFAWLLGGMALLFVLVTLREWVVGQVKNNARRYIDDA